MIHFNINMEAWFEAQSNFIFEIAHLIKNTGLCHRREGKFHTLGKLVSAHRGWQVGEVHWASATHPPCGQHPAAGCFGYLRGGQRPNTPQSYTNCQRAPPSLQFITETTSMGCVHIP